MMNDLDRRNMHIARLLYAGSESERAGIARDITWHVPGHNPVSGEYRGYDAYTKEMPARMSPLTRWEFKLGDVMVNGHFVMTTFRLEGERNGMRIDTTGGHLLRMNDEGQVLEGWGFVQDQDALDDFFAG